MRHAEAPPPLRVTRPATAEVGDPSADQEWLSLPIRKQSLGGLLYAADDPSVFFRSSQLNPADKYIAKSDREAFIAVWRLHKSQIDEVDHVLGGLRVFEFQSLVKQGHYEVDSQDREIPIEAFSEDTKRLARPGDTLKAWRMLPGDEGKVLHMRDGVLHVVPASAMVESQKAVEYRDYLRGNISGLTVSWFGAMGMLHPRTASELVATTVATYACK